MSFRLTEGNGVAFYQIGVLDSGQVTGLTSEEVFETVIVLFYMTTTLRPKGLLGVEKVRRGIDGISVELRVTQAKTQKHKNFTKELEDIQIKHSPLLREESETETKKLVELLQQNPEAVEAEEKKEDLVSLFGDEDVFR